MRAFRGAFLVAIDDVEATEQEQREEDAGPASLEELKSYLAKAVRPVLNDEEHGNPCGVQSVEMLFEELTELPQDEVRRLYDSK